MIDIEFSMLFDFFTALRSCPTFARVGWGKPAEMSHKADLF